VLLRAYQRWEDETSDASGLGMYVSRTTDPNIRFDIRERLDLAAAELEKWDEAHQGKKRTPGMTRHAVAVDAVTGVELDLGGLAREQFFQEAEAEAKRLATALAGGSGIEVEVDDGVFVERLAPGQKYDPSEYGDGAVASDETTDPDPQN